MSQLKKSPATRAVCLSVLVGLTLALSGCWEHFFVSLLSTEPSEMAVVYRYNINTYTGEGRETTRYADGHEKWIYTDAYNSESVMILEADGSLRSRTGPFDPRTVDKQIHVNRLRGSEIRATKWRREAEEARSKADFRPYAPRSKERDMAIALDEEAIWWERNLRADRQHAIFLDKVATSWERDLRADRQHYFLKYGEKAPSIYDDTQLSTDDMLGVGSARPTGVTDVPAFTPPDVPTGPPPGAIVRPPPIHIPHPD